MDHLVDLNTIAVIRKCGEVVPGECEVGNKSATDIGVCELFASRSDAGEAAQCCWRLQDGEIQQGKTEVHFNYEVPTYCHSFEANREASRKQFAN